MFETSEQVTSGTMNGVANTVMTLSIPAIGSGVTAGVHRMRAVDAYASTPNPCGPPAVYGEMNDYSVNIIPYACKLDHF